MVSSVTSNAAVSTATLSASQCRASRDPQALQEKLFSKLDVNGDGGIDQSELSQFMDFASSSTTSTNPTSDTAGADLFKAMDTDGDGTLSKTELADGAKKLFDQLRTQLMTASAGTASTGAAADAQPADATQAPPPSRAGGHHHHGGGGGMFSKIASLLDQYRSTATDPAAATADASTLSVAA
ncbi:MAG: EF-hand domain-containing protein [Gammaproteobacteria bacterium]